MQNYLYFYRFYYSQYHIYGTDRNSIHFLALFSTSQTGAPFRIAPSNKLNDKIGRVGLATRFRFLEKRASRIGDSRKFYVVHLLFGRYFYCFRFIWREACLCVCAWKFNFIVFPTYCCDLHRTKWVNMSRCRWVLCVGNNNVC